MKRAPFTALTLVAAAIVPSLVGGCGSSTAGDNTDLGVNSIIIIKRQNTIVGPNGQVTVDVAGGNNQVLDYDRYEPGGSLNILSPPRPDGTLTNITAAFTTADFNGADVSFDATQVVFSMKKDGNDHYHIYTAQLTPGPGGQFEIHQLTNGDQDDDSPIYIAGGRIAFVTNQMYTAMGTRADEYEHGRAVTQLAFISVEGGDADRQLGSQNLSHTVAPFLRADGKVGYSRWEHFSATNDVKLFAANPDSTQMVAVGGQHGKPANSIFSIHEFAPNQMIAIGTDRDRTIHAGALIQIDARNQKDPVCLNNTADQTGHPCLDEENTQFTVLTPDVPTGNGPSPVGRYREPSVLPDGRILTSWADGPVNDLSEQSATPPDFGVYLFDPTTKTNQLIYNDRSTWDLNAIAIAPHAEPPVLPSIVSDQDTTIGVKIGSINVRTTSLQETVNGAEFNNTQLSDALQQAVAVRIIEGFSSEAAKGVSMFGLTMDEGAAVLGETPVNPDGSWLALVPPYIPMHVQPIDKFGMTIRNQRLWIQGQPGEDRRCVGCHESRTGQSVPALGANPTVAEQKGTASSDFSTIPIAQRVEYPWDNTAQYPVPVSDQANMVQTVLNNKCVQCHGGGANDPDAGKTYVLTRTDPATGQTTQYTIPYLLLTEAPITVVYDRMVATYPSSYVSLFYPAAMDMGMGQTTVTGQMPPKWAIPEDARESALIQKLNVIANDGTTAFPGATHPEDVGVTLTAAERTILIRSIDLGGQFYSRQNTGFVPYAQTPVGLNQ